MTLNVLGLYIANKKFFFNGKGVFFTRSIDGLNELNKIQLLSGYKPK